MRRGLFHKYIMGFASFFLVPMVVLSVCLQIVMYTNLSREIITYNENVLERLGDDLITMNGRLIETGNKISFSSLVSMNGQAEGIEIDLVNMLRQENAENSYISKIYLIYEEDDICYSSQGTYSKRALLSNQLSIPEAEQNGFFEKLYDTNEVSYDIINKEYHLSGDIMKKAQIILIYPLHNYGKSPEAWAVLELQSTALQEGMETSLGNYSRGMAVLNQENQILMETGDITELTDNLDEVLGEEELTYGKCNLIKIAGNKKALVVYPLKNFDAILVNLIEKPTLLEDLIRNHSILSFGFLLFLAVGCVMSIYIAYHYYKPIYQLAQYMKQSNDEENETDELSFSKSQYDNLNEVKESLNREIENQWPLVEERLVTKLLFGTAEDKNESGIVEGILENQMRQQEHAVVLIAAKKKGTVDISRLYKEKECAVKEVLDSEYSIYISSLYYFEALAVIVSKQKMTETDIQNVSVLLTEVFQPDRYLMSVGKIYEGTSGVHLSYLEAITNLKYKMLNPNKKIQLEDTEDNERYSSVIVRYQTECLLSINHCLECENEEEIIRGIEEMRLNLEELPGQIALMCCYDIVAHLLRELKKEEIHLREDELYHLTSFGTVEEFGMYLKAVMLRIRQKKETIKTEIRNDLADQILNYIDENYQDCNLCLVGMAEHFGYSSSYLSKFITQNLHVSFSELVSKKRLDYTKECLVRTDKPIAQIAQEAGYANLSNFTRRFKHAENMTPGQYRSLYKNGGENR